MRISFAILFLVAGLVSVPRAARALDCATLPNPAYVAGSTAAKPVLAAIGPILAAQTSPATLVYSGQGSCKGVDAILNGTPFAGSGTTAFSYWKSDGTEATCDVPSPGVVIDLGISDVFATTCVPLPGGLPPNTADYLGPVQTMLFVVPSTATQSSISAEAAYNIFGFGADSGVAPWTDPASIFHRDANSGTQRMIAAAIGVPPDKWMGTTASSSSDLVTRLTNGSGSDDALGILSADVAQESKGIMVLPYQHTGQSCGYWPDATGQSNEKLNVRDGHYAIWGPMHLLTRIGASGYPVNPAAGDVVAYLIGSKTAPGTDLISIEAHRHVVPQCAMRVRRSTEMGPLASYAPRGSCGCYYDAIANGATTCRACLNATDCPTSAPICNYGYCETQ